MVVEKEGNTLPQPSPSTVDGNALKYLACFGLEQQSPPEKAIGFLLQGVLAQGPTGGMTLEDACRALREATGLDFDGMELRRCAEEDPLLGITVLKNEPEVAVIEAGRRDECLGRLRDAAAEDERVVLEWAAAAFPSAPSGPELSPDVLASDLKVFCRRVALKHGMETVALVYGDGSSATDFLNGVDESSWSCVQERAIGYRAFCRERFPDFFVQATGSRSAFIARLLDRTFELCRLSLAPSAERALRATFSGVVVYLDTNVLFRLLGLNGPVPHLDVRRVLDLGKRMGVVARVTPRTLREFDTAAESRIRSGSRFISPAALVGISPDLEDRAFFAEYRRLFAGKQLLVGDLRASIRGIARTLELWGVEVSTEGVGDVDQAPDSYASIARELHDYYDYRQSRKAPEERRSVPWETAEHDAYHLALIRRLRPKDVRAFADAKYWFLTFHVALARKAALLPGAGLAPTILFGQWHQLLRSMLPRSEAFDTTFTRNFYSPLFQGHRGSYVAAMEAVANRLGTMKYLSAEHFASIVADQAFTARVAALTGRGTSEATHEIDDAIAERLQLELRSEREARVQASQRADSETVRAGTAAERAAAEAAARAAAEQQVRDLSQELALRKAELSSAQLEITEARERAKRMKRVLRLSLGVVVLLCIPALWIWGVQGWTVRVVPLNAPAVSVALLGAGLLALLPRRWALITGLVALVVTVMSVAPWPTAPSNTSPPSGKLP